MMLVIAMVHLEEKDPNCPYNFERVFDSYREFTQSSSMGIGVVSGPSIDYKSLKPIALRSFESLLQLEIICPVRKDRVGLQLPKELIMVRLMVDTDLVKEVVENDYPLATTAMRQWL